MSTATDHFPCQFSHPILDEIGKILGGLGLPVHDPFAGTGVRLGRMCDKLGLTFTGTEIEPEFHVDDRVWTGDSTQAMFYPAYPPACYVIVTSPAYPNGMADHFHARDGSERHTYRQALASITGEDRPLHEHNMGRYGARSGVRALDRHLALAHRCVTHWPDHAVVNVSDFIIAGTTFPLVAIWHALLGAHGYVIAPRIEVRTPRQRKGANSQLRVETEAILVAER